MRLAFTLLTVLTPAFAFAAGSEDPTPPKPSETTMVCEQGKIWDEKAEACVAAEESRLDDETLYRAAREFAYVGQFGNALQALDAMSDQADDRVLTYRGFAHRKMGDVARGMSYYRAAIEANPDNLLARSYMGQALVEAGDTEAATLQLAEIRARGGRETWPEWSLKSALRTGNTHAY